MKMFWASGATHWRTAVTVSVDTTLKLPTASTQFPVEES